MSADGVEMFIGGIQDSMFGPVIFCGSGGVLVELVGDAVCRLCPVSDRDVEEMLGGLRAARQLRGFRGRPPADEAALRDALLRVSALLTAFPEIQEMDINPFTVMTAGASALDLRIRVGPALTRPTHYIRY